jgi:hypothetical protein
LFPAIFFPCTIFFFLPPPSRPLLRCETQLLPARARLQQKKERRRRACQAHNSSDSDERKRR